MAPIRVESSPTWQAIVETLTRSFEAALASGARVMLTVYLGDPVTGEVADLARQNAGDAGPVPRQKATASQESTS